MRRKLQTVISSAFIVMFAILAVGSGPDNCPVCTPTPVEDSFDGSTFDDLWIVQDFETTEYLFDGSAVIVNSGPQLENAAQLSLSASCPDYRDLDPSECSDASRATDFEEPLELTLDFACAVPVQSCQVDVQLFDQSSGAGVLVGAELLTEEDGTPTLSVFRVLDYGLELDGGNFATDVPVSWDVDSTITISFDPAISQLDVTATDAEGNESTFSATGQQTIEQYVISVNTSGQAYTSGEPTARLSNLTTNLTIE